MKKTNPTLAVFTPAYNRAHTIERTYKSLCRQTSHDFMWVIVDDGSKDNTKELVKAWLVDNSRFQKINENEFIGYAKDADWLKIHYIWKENGGMHTAHNTAYEHIDTELAVCIDSDDWMPDNGVEVIVTRWERDGGEQYAGLIGLDVFEDGYVIGPPVPNGWKSCKTYEMEHECHVFCDQKYVYRPDVIKKYLPYPVYPGERYGQVNWVYQVIDNDYDMLCSNDVYCVVEYQAEGLSLNVLGQYRQSPNTRMYECNKLMTAVPYFKENVKRAIQYNACAIILKKWHLMFKSSRPWLTTLTFPLGIAYYIYMSNKKQKPLDPSASRIIHSKDLNK